MVQITDLNTGSTAPLLVFDIESTGVDVFEDRIVQFVMGLSDDHGNLTKTWEWVINPGVPVPEGASGVHGFTTEYLQEHGESPKMVLPEILEVFGQYHSNVLIAYNMNFDLSMLDAEFRRYGIHQNFAEVAEQFCTLFDPIVWDRAKSFRKGKRKLMNLADHYRIEYDEDSLHNALADVELTAKVAVAVAARYGLPTTDEQKVAYRKWAANLEKWLRRSDKDAVVSGEWPYRIDPGLSA